MNWLESSGDSGSWFFSCVVNSDRKVCSLSASRLRELLSLSETDAPAEVAVGSMVVVMVWA